MVSSGQPPVDLHLEQAPGDREGAGDLALGELVGLPHVDDRDLLPRLEARLERRRPHLGDGLERFGHHLRKRLPGTHGRAGYWLALPSLPCEQPLGLRRQR